MKRSSKRRRQPGKMTYSQLVERGHDDLAKHVLWRRGISNEGHPPRFKMALPQHRYLSPEDL
jgi:hypothetical protein